MANSIGSRLVDDLLARPCFMHYDVGDVHAIHYAEACAGYGAARIAGILGDEARMQRIVARYSIELTASEAPGKELNTANHVDANVYGILPLELYMRTGAERFLAQGLALADGQWDEPLEGGMTRQARYWADDIYMIASLQIQAFKATGKNVYLERASRMAESYLERLQLPDGLFYHGDGAPFRWGRGNGWVAAGLAELLSSMNPSDAYFENIARAFVRMAKALKAHQRASGLWGQLIDDPEAWDESSCTAMFAYAISLGIDAGILRKDEFAVTRDRAWQALVNLVDEDGKLQGVCAGTGKSADRAYYLDRPRIDGDLHGQAAILWLCSVMGVSCETRLVSQEALI